MGTEGRVEGRAMREVRSMGGARVAGGASAAAGVRDAIGVSGPTSARAAGDARSAGGERVAGGAAAAGARTAAGVQAAAGVSAAVGVRAASGASGPTSARAAGDAHDVRGARFEDGKGVAMGTDGGNRRVTRHLWAAGGFLFFGLAMVGVALPFLPTTPFLLVAAFCFARSSEKLNTWFKSTKLYHKVLEGYVTRRRMTVKAKLTILVPVTILLGIGFALMANVPVGRAVVAVVWVAHVVYFGFVVKTDRES
ncbi:MAG TPA: YbaN family protein [Rubneribacter badeniensis]|uniref:YbaN family protein n=1 Tax=Rubneribacter badeniensis TaxID=2070688 RepID=A0A9D3AD75_9ACTN|nr:YbaN family protein [Rubneribacter badeniensis]